MRSPSSKLGDRGHVSEPPDFSDLNVDVRDTDAERRARDPTSPSAADLSIPSGNTMKMASFWDKREAAT